jgi:hypothetical protein
MRVKAKGVTQGAEARVRVRAKGVIQGDTAVVVLQIRVYS